MAIGLSPSSQSSFDDAYATGVSTALRPTRTGLGGPVGNTSRKLAAADGAIALGGTVIRADRSMKNGWVIIADGVINDVVSNEPSGMKTIHTGGVILPGLLDLHGHPEFNIFSAWEPPKTFINRNQWRSSSIYQQLVRDPWEQLTTNGTVKSVKKAMTRYAEVRAVVGGVTAIQGASQDYPNKAEALVRNVDLLIFGTQVARSTVDFGRLRPGDVASIEKGINNKTVKAHYVHLAEGQKTNQASVNEFLAFADTSMFGPTTVMIHGTALGREHFDQLASVGGKLVWSPQSNLRLYDETTDIAAALEAKVPIAIGADWMPSGSPSLLHELKIAQRSLADQGCTITPKELVAMVTSDAADIAGLGDKLGRIAPGRAADIVVLRRDLGDPYENIVNAYPSWVDLVMIGGDIVFGRNDWVSQVVDVNDYEVVRAWGREMALDTRFGSPEQSPDGPPRRLADIRQRLIARYPALGPVFA